MTEPKLRSKFRISRLQLLAVIGTATVGGPVVFAVLAPPAKAQSAPSQSPTAQTLQAMEAAGTKKSFDVTSVKLDKSGEPAHTNVPMAPNAPYPPTGGLFSATNFRLQTYLAWAYGLRGYEALRLFDQYPAWALTDHFDIEARADGTPTKPEMQLMMQSLLADRFKLKVHRESRQGQVFALILSKPGKTGMQLKPHLDDESCSTPLSPPAPGAAAGNPTPCGVIVATEGSVPGRERLGARSVTIEQIAEYLPAIGVSEINRPVIDRTGLSGNFDFAIEFVPELPAGAAPDVAPGESSLTFLQALRDQLGLKLESTTGPVDILVIDHVEEPSAN